MPVSKNSKNHKKRAAARGKKRSLEMIELKKRFLSWADKKEKELQSNETPEEVVPEYEVIEDGVLSEIEG